METEKLKNYIIQSLNHMNEEDERFLKQVSTFIKKYREEKQGH